MLTPEKIKENKENFLSILSEVKREGIEPLTKWLETTDFFTAPASTRYHESFEGGLCSHSLNVFDNFRKLNELYGKGLTFETAALCSLLHDLCKINFYKASTRNVKNDTTGQWEKVPFYAVEDAFPMGHGEKSVFLIERFVRLSPSEAVAVRWHMGGFDDAARGSLALSGAFEKYPEAIILHLADLAATYVTPIE